MTDRRLSVTLAVLPVAYLVLAAGLAHVDRPFFWGINHLRYFPAWVWSPCVVALIAVAVPVVRNRILSLTLPDLPVRMLVVGLAFVGTVAFSVFNAATHLLGDGYLLTRELEGGFRKIANEPLSLWLLTRIHGALASRGVTAFEVYTVWSIASGAVFLLMLPAVARRLTSSHVVLVLLVLLPGYTQIFFGYHETYPALYPLLLLYVACAAETLRSRLSPWVPMAVLGLLVALHFKMATLIPSAIFLLAPEGSFGQRVRSIRKNIRACIPGLLLFGILLRLTNFDLADYRSRASEETFLPLLGSPTHSIPYTTFSVDHLVEFLNEQLLVYLPILLLLPFVRRSWWKTETSQFLLAAAIPAWLTTFFGFTVIGAFRDWDALAFPALLFVLWMGTQLAETTESSRLRSIVLVVAVTAGIHQLLWVSVNANPDRSTARFEDCLDYSHLSGRARSFGWETIGAHYLEQGDLPEASLSYEAAITSAPKHPRYPSQLGFILMQLGQVEEAAEQFRRSIELDDERFETHLNLGMAQLQLGDADAAVNAIRRAWVLAPERTQIPFALGVAYYTMEEYQKAIGAHLAVLRLNPDHVDAHMHLAQLYGLLGDNDRRRDHFERVMKLNPEHPQREEIEAWLKWYRGQVPGQ